MSKKTFNINNSIYSLELLLQTQEYFEGYDITIDRNTLSIDDENPQFVFDEFMNCALSIYSEIIAWA